MTADGWTKAVRQQLGLGRVLPLGGPHDGAWITESAARTALRRAAGSLPGLSLGRLRISSVDSGGKKGEDTDGYGHETAVPPPPSALPPGPLRVTADLAASAGPAAEPLPATAARLRKALFAAAGDRLGLTVAEVDLRVTHLVETDTGPSDLMEADAESPDLMEADAESPDLMEADAESPDLMEADAESPKPLETDAGPSGPAPGPSSSAAASTAAVGDDKESRVAAAALSVPGVARLTGVFGGLGVLGGLGGADGPARAVAIAAGPALSRRHVRVELAVTEERRALDVAREVRAAVSDSLPDHPSVAVLITAVGT
ncbi:nucleopolyhedrovirus P10 family protein [Streptomyces sp. SP18BB07]|uniref:nucleopolyhedrovirus P10 family protein n=1 Tax=Streptomyces sp. SP18BB07 TaxID=3002522 RepID=UPI002E78913E|nr:nucleopolyhedrovirus P10 family protein [Streptomyces sp. SP18BB07]MEE1765743.1 nucleopolyhedrovirus P10 family protein [Streptomyces sp. SP18BB07]